MNNAAIVPLESAEMLEGHNGVPISQSAHGAALKHYKSPRYIIQDTSSALSMTQHGSFIIGASPSMRSLFKKVNALADLPTTILIRGETGTGKELCARALHYNASDSQRRGKFVAVNCAGIPQSLLESHLFGHVRGAFTDAYADRKGFVEEANNGTLFLDEIGDMSQYLQAKILRLLQEHEIIRVGDTARKHVNVRIIAATNQDLEEKMRRETFRSDLFYRINTFPLTIPPLRERLVDIPHLAQHFIAKYNEVYRAQGFAIKGVTESALGKLHAHRWPGNVRELENIIARAIILRSRGQLREEDIVFDDQKLQKRSPATPLRTIPFSLKNKVPSESPWYEEGVFPVMYYEIRYQQNVYPDAHIKELIHTNQVYAVNVNPAKNFRTFALMLTPESLNLLFIRKDFEFYRRLKQNIRDGPFNKVIKKPFMLTSFSRLRKFGIKFSNETFQDVIRKVRPYCIAQESRAYFALEEEQASEIVLGDTRNGNNQAGRCKDLQDEIQRQYRHFLTWKPGEPSWEVL